MDHVLAVLGYWFDINQMVGLGPLMRSDSQTDGIPVLEIYFDILLVHYPLRISTGKMSIVGYTEKQRYEKAQQYFTAYARLSDFWKRIWETKTEISDTPDPEALGVPNRQDTREDDN
jgi:hypothetical protein